MKIKNLDHADKCFRCHSTDTNNLMYCHACGVNYCVGKPGNPCIARCACYEMRLSVWPECREYYDLLYRCNAVPESYTPAVEAILTDWEEMFSERGL